MVAKKKVTVFGAGVAGLTAAHELVMRNFDVVVVDPKINPFITASTLDRGIGGMARSQWVVDVSAAQTELTQLQPSTEFLIDETVLFTDDTANPNQVATIKQKLCALKTAGWLQALFIYVVFQDEPSDETLKKDPRSIAIRDWLTAVGVEENIQKLMVYPTVDSDPGMSNTVRFRSAWPILPAEHGFRFFPSFYRHVFDSMKRTQILYPRDSDGGQTVYDNLVPVEGLGIAVAGKRTSFLLDRKPIRSFEQLRKLLELALDELQWTGEDIARFSLKIFEYMTSSSKRRALEYENMSWGDFVDLELYSNIMQSDIEFGPQMLLSLRGSQSDARSQGTILTQLLLNQIVDGTQPDGTLGAPTSGAWFDHWHRFLLDQGVKFRRGTLSLVWDDTLKKIQPQIVDDAATEDCVADYFVLALPVQTMADIARTLDAKAFEGTAGRQAETRDLQAIIKFLKANTERNVPNSPLRDMSGIQFYFDTEVRFWRGHTQYMDSEWGLTSISQPQFWFKAREPAMGYRSLLSVDIGIWDRPSRPTKDDGPLTAWECATPVELARRVWAQVEDGHNDAFQAKYGPNAKFPQPRQFALDQAIKLAKLKKDQENLLPYLVNVAGQYPTRPGELASKDPKAEPHYSVCDGIVLAGTHMKTYTRITSMEAANESARHAVNAILQADGAKCDGCEIWDPEDNELPDLQWLRDLDEELFDKKLPHVVKILGWSELPAMLLPHMFKNIANRGARS